MNLVDSSGWLEYLTEGRNADFFAPTVEDTEHLMVSTINIYEVFKRVFLPGIGQEAVAMRKSPGQHGGTSRRTQSARGVRS